MDMRIGYRTYTCTDKWEIVGVSVLHSECNNINKSLKVHRVHFVFNQLINVYQ